MTKISIILSAYNEELRLAQTLDSLLDQTLRDIEIICVNNGSTDASPAILEKYASQDARIRILTQDRQSMNAARNLGLKALPQGEFLAFLSAGYVFDPSLLEKAYNQAQSVGGADVVLFGAQDYRSEKDGLSIAPYCLQRDLLPDSPTFSRLDEPERFFEIATPTLSNKLFRRDFILEENIEFKPYESSNSTCFVLTALAMAQSITSVDEKLAFHQIEEGETPARDPVAESATEPATLPTDQPATNIDPTDFLDAYEATYAELQSRHIYQDVEKSFTNSVIAECAARLGAVQTDEERLKICTKLQESAFTDMGLLDHPDEYYLNENDLVKVRGTKYVVEWHNKLNELNQKNDPNFHVLVDQRPTDTTPFVSVIIPVYNVEPWLKECLDSVVSQSLQNIEIICVDDGSTDNSQAILLEYATRDKRLAVYAQNNSGLSTSRNNGASLARGTYLYFIDSDDYIAPQALDLLYQRSEKDALDVLYFDRLGFADSPEYEGKATMLNKEHQNDFAYLSESIVYEGSEIFIQMVQHKEFRSPVWFQFFNREFCLKNKLNFYEGILHEDELFTFQSMLSASRAGYVPQALYYRRYRSDSIMSAQASFSNVYSYLVVYLEMFRFLFNQNIDGLLAEAIPQELNRILGCARRNYLQLSPEEQQSALALPPAQRQIFKSCIADLGEAQTELNEVNNVLSKTKAYLNKEINENTQLRKANDSLVAIDSSHDAIDLTIVIPVYNALPYFYTCIESITSQNLGPYSLEVIIVDDGSTDGSGEYCDELAREFNYVRTIHIFNTGTPSRPRNIGIEEAKGCYIFFCDADDYFEQDALAAMLDHAYEDDCDIGFVKTQGEGGRKEADVFKDNKVWKYLTVENYLETNPLFLRSYGVGKLHKRSLIEEHEIRFPEKVAFEDRPFEFECYFNATNICIYNDRVYYHWVWRDNGTSLSQEGATAHVWSTLEVIISSFEYFFSVASRYCSPSDYPVIYRYLLAWQFDIVMPKLKDADTDFQENALARIRTCFEPCRDSVPLRQILQYRLLVRLDSLFLCDTKTFLELFDRWPERASISFTTSSEETLSYSIYTDDDNRLLLQAPVPLDPNQYDQPIKKPKIFKNQITYLQTTNEAFEMAGHAQALLRSFHGNLTAKLKVHFIESEEDRLLETIEIQNLEAERKYASVYQMQFDWSTQCSFEDLLPANDLANADKTRIYFSLDIKSDAGVTISRRLGNNRVEGVFSNFICQAVWYDNYLFAPYETVNENLISWIYHDIQPVASAKVGFIKHNDKWSLEIHGELSFYNYAATTITLTFLNKDGIVAWCFALEKGKNLKDKKFKGSAQLKALDRKLKKGAYTLELRVEVANKTLCTKALEVLGEKETSIEYKRKNVKLCKTDTGTLVYEAH